MSLWVTFFLFITIMVVTTITVGHYMAKVFENKPTLLSPILEPIERFLLKLSGVGNNPPAMRWQDYCKALVLFNLFCGLFTFFVLRYQYLLPLNPLNLPGMEPWQALNTICSFVTNTNWQSYSGEQTLSNLTQMLGITFAQAIGAASGIAVCVALLRGLTNRPLGNFYRDHMRTVLYVLMPVMVIGSIFFISHGVPQTLDQQAVVKTVEGGVQKIAMGPVASLLAIKQFGTNGGGFFNANSAHPYENPDPLTDIVEIAMELSVSMGLIYTFGLWLKDKRQAWMIWGSMMLLFLVSLAVGFGFEQWGNPVLTHHGIEQISTALQSGGNMEGKEVRFGIFPSLLFTTATTATSTGAVNNMHDSLTPLAGLTPLWNMMLNIIFGGVGVGLMGFLLYGIIAVFLTGLMVGRTPEIFGKKIEKPEIILASIAILLHPLIILLPTAISAIAPFGLSSLNNAGPHGFSEILYAFTSSAANNGSAFAGLNANTPWYNIAIGIVILLGRYVSVIALLAIAGSLLSKPKAEPGPGTLKTNTPLFAAVWISVIVIVGALTFVPALVLGPIAEYLEMVAGKLY